MARDCSRINTAVFYGAPPGIDLVPIPELGNGTYETLKGGLYLDGLNTRPRGHTMFGLETAKTVRDNPLNAAGAVDQADGVILFSSLGMSMAQLEWGKFDETIHVERADLNPKVVFFQGAAGARTIEDMDQITDTYWDEYEALLVAAGHSLAQVRVVWLQVGWGTEPAGAFAVWLAATKTALVSVIQNIKTLCPNCLMCYVQPRIYSGYTTDPERTEPYAHWLGWAFREILSTQILSNIELNHNPDLTAPVVAPWLSWAAYSWGNGTKGTLDGLYWYCNDFVEDDGYHDSEIGKQKVADRMIRYFTQDETSKIWLLA